MCILILIVHAFFVLFVCVIKTVINVWSLPEGYNFVPVIPYGRFGSNGRCIFQTELSFLRGECFFQK